MYCSRDYIYICVVNNLFLEIYCPLVPNFFRETPTQCMYISLKPSQVKTNTLWEK